jgi:hypothetical protein
MWASIRMAGFRTLLRFAVPDCSAGAQDPALAAEQVSFLDHSVAAGTKLFGFSHQLRRPDALLLLRFVSWAHLILTFRSIRILTMFDIEQKR